MRLTRKVFTDLAIWMIGFGLMIGVVFPFFTLLLGVSAHIALSGVFFLSCIIAGIVVGFVNILLTRLIVGKRLKMMTERMLLVKSHIMSVAKGDESKSCTPESCSIQIDSDDEFGESARAFNQLIESFSISLQTQSTIRKYTETLSSQLELDALGEKALRMLMDHASADAGAIMAEIDGELKLIASYGIQNVESLTNSSLVLNALKESKLLAFNLPEDIVVESILTKFRPKEVIVEPVKYKGVPLGIIILASASQFDMELKKGMDIFAYSLALSLHNSLEHDQLQKLAALDPLTGIYNRRFGLSRLHEEYTRSVRSGISLSVVIFDIDHFKQVNDTYGHIAGDRVIKTISQIARTALREGDVLVRYGGDEFLIILPGASKEDSYKISEKLLRMINEAEISYGDSKIKFTISMGCDAFPETDVNSEQDLLLNADEALYRAKESGRNRAVIH